MFLSYLNTQRSSIFGPTQYHHVKSINTSTIPKTNSNQDSKFGEIYSIFKYIFNKEISMLFTTTL